MEENTHKCPLQLEQNANFCGLNYYATIMQYYITGN